MNRAILIVICDFLVSSMLSMMTGMVPAHSGGSGVGLDEQSTRVLLVELEKNRSELLKLRAALQAKSENSSLTKEEEEEFRRLAGLIAANGLKIEKLEELGRSNPENTGVLTKEELAKRLDAEKLRRIEAEFLAREKSDSLKETRDALRDSRADVAKLSDNLAKISSENVEGIKKLAEKESKIASQQVEIEKARLAANELSGQIDVVTRRSGKLESDLAYTSGKLATAERSLASSSDEINRLNRELERLKVEKGESAAARKEMEGTLQRTVGELTRASAELTRTRAELAESRASEKLAAGKLQILEKQFRNDVFARYDRSAVNLKISVGESRVLKDFRRVTDNYLPTVRIGNKVFVFGATAMFAGGVGQPFHFRGIDQLSYQIVKGKNSIGLAGSLIVAKSEPQLAAVELPSQVKCTPLNALSAETLRERGVQQLYLFKASSLGKDSAPLGDRCALDMQGNTPALIVRNTARGAMELKAQIGDFILTREGDFIGIIVSVTDNGRFQEARAVLCNAPIWENAFKISVAADKDGIYRAFGDFMREHIVR